MLFKKTSSPEKTDDYKKLSWRELYQNGGKLKLAAAICAEVARLVTLEFSSSIRGSERAELLNDAYRYVTERARFFCEIACATGGVMLKPYIENGKLKTAIVSGDSFEVTSSDPDGTIVGAKFYETINRAKESYLKCEEHLMIGDRYFITNKAYIKNGNELKEIPLSEVLEWQNLEEETILTGVKAPLFSYFKMPSPPLDDFSSPLGAPIFARAAELIEDASMQYKRLLWEFESGERALYVDETALRRGAKNDAVLPDKRLYRLLSTGNDELFNDWSPEIRDEAIINGFERILQRIEFNCGLAYGTISDPQAVEKTAEEIRSSKQRSYATVTEIQTALKTALLGLVKAYDILCDIYSLCPKGEYTLNFTFDDSIVADRKTEFLERIELLKEGVLTKEEMRKWYLDEGECDDE